MNTENQIKLSEDILSIISNAGGAESITTVLSYLRKGFSESGRRWKSLCSGTGAWRGTSSVGWFEDRCKELGFTVREGKNSRNQTRTEVTL